LGSVLIAKPNNSSWITGMPMIMPNVSRSRFSWMNSFRMIPIQRDSENDSRVIAPPARRASGR
jgi:hypothetical protein